LGVCFFWGGGWFGGGVGGVENKDYWVTKELWEQAVVS